MPTQRLLLRAGLDPHTELSAEEIVLNAPSAGLFGKNAGNMLFQDAMYRILSTPTAKIVVDQLRTERGYAPLPAEPYGPITRHLPSVKRTAHEINSSFDMLVLPLANAFRFSLAPSIERLTKIIEQLTIPVVVVGVGMQRKFANADKPLDPRIAELATNFVHAVLEHSESIGVRGAITKANLVRLGLPEHRIDIIGCPSLFATGRDLAVAKSTQQLERDAPLALNTSPYVRRANAFMLRQAKRFPNATYIPQVVDDLQLMLWAREPAVRKHDNLVQTATSPLYTADRMRFFLDSSSWVAWMQSQTFAVGSRIHGNIAALRAGTPAFVLAHDTRTLEIAEYHEIPHRRVQEVTKATNAEELYAAADFDAFNAGHAARFATFQQFLRRNSIPNIFDEGNSARTSIRRDPVTVRFPNGPSAGSRQAYAAAQTTHTAYLTSLGRQARPTFAKQLATQVRHALRK